MTPDSNGRPKSVVVAMLLAGAICASDLGAAPAPGPIRVVGPPASRPTTTAATTRPDDAYRKLVADDLRTRRPVDEAWLAKVKGMVPDGFRVVHGLHFTLLTNADDKLAARTLAVLEDTYSIYYRDLPNRQMRPMPPPQRLPCMLFASREEWRKHVEQHEGKVEDWSVGQYSNFTNRMSLFDSLDDENHRAMRKQIEDLDAERDALKQELAGGSPRGRANDIQRRISGIRTQQAMLTSRMELQARLTTESRVRHECAHMLSNNSGILRRERTYPFWLNEGIAGCFELADVTSGRAGPGLKNTFRLQVYRTAERNKRLVSLADIVENKLGSADLDIGESYAQAWALVYYLWNRKAEPFADFVDRLSRTRGNAPTRPVFEESFGKDLDALEADWRRFMRGL